MSNSQSFSAGFESGKHLVAGQKVLGRYTLKQILGQGGMGVVWLASDDLLNHNVALKFLPSLIVNDLASLNDLKREAKRSLELSHPHIVRTYSFEQDESMAGISMEYIDSNTLRHRRVAQAGGIFEPAEIGEWTKQLCDALDYAHHQVRIVHRDLKPANLMVNSRNHLKVADFGISRSLVEVTTQVSGMSGGQGTLVYMSPQQLAGDPPHPSDDVYAIGATLYDLCTTKPPFYRGEISPQIRHNVAPSMGARRAELGIAGAELPENWETTVAACLSKEVSQRPKSAGEVAALLGLKPFAEVLDPASFQPPAPHAASGPVRVPKSPVSGSGNAAPHSGTGFQPPPAIIPARQRGNPVPFVVAIAGVLVAALAVLWLGSRSSSEKKTAPVADTAKKEDSVQLVPTPKPPEPSVAGLASCYIDTEPREALVSIDGRPAEKSPQIFKGLKPGSHTLKVTKPGYDDVDQTIEIADDKRLEPPPIELVQSTGFLTVEANDPQATISVKNHSNGQIVGGGPGSWKSPKLPVGMYEITASKGDLTTTAKQVTIERGRETLEKVDMTSPGFVTFTNPSPDVKVLLDGKEKGKTTEKLTLAPGKYVLHLAGPAIVKDSDRPVVVQSGETVVLDGALEKKENTVIHPIIRPSYTGSGQSRPQSGGGDNGRSGLEKANGIINTIRNFQSIAPH